MSVSSVMIFNSLLFSKHANLLCIVILYNNKVEKSIAIPK